MRKNEQGEAQDTSGVRSAPNLADTPLRARRVESVAPLATAIRPKSSLQREVETQQLLKLVIGRFVVERDRLLADQERGIRQLRRIRL